MNNKYLHWLGLFVSLTLFSQNMHAAYNHDPSLDWKTLHTPNFEIHFHDGETELANEVAEIAEKVHHELTRYFNWKPSDPTHLILNDRVDFANGFAYPIPNNTMTIYVSPPDDLDVLDDYSNWLHLLITHEYTHIIHIDKALGAPEFIRNILGRFLLLFPNGMQPAWLIEGLATYKESSLETEIGRGENNYFKSLMRQEVLNGIRPLREVNQPKASWPAGTTRYLYGVYFFNFLRDRYGEDKITKWVDNYSNNLLPFALNNASIPTVGKTMDQLWVEFSDYLNQQFRPEIERINKAGLQQGVQITQHGYYTGFPRSLANGDLYYIKDDFLEEAQLMRLTNGSSHARSLGPIHGQQYDVHPDAGVLIAQLDFYNNTNIYSDIYLLDPDSGDQRQLTHEARYRHVAWHPDGEHIFAVHSHLGRTELHLLDKLGTLQSVLWQGKDKEILGPLDVSADAQNIVASVWRPQSHWELELFSIQDKTWRNLTHSDEVEKQPQFTANGKAIIYSADYNGLYNIQYLDIESGTVSTLTNLTSGAFSATYSESDQRVYYMGLGQYGFDIYRVDNALQNVFKTQSLQTLVSKRRLNQTTEEEEQETHPATPSPATDSESKPDNDTTWSTTPYSPFSSLAPTSWFPYFYLDEEEDRAELGGSTFGQDALGRHSYSAAFAYDVINDWPIGFASYSYDRWYPSFKLSYLREIETRTYDKDVSDEVDYRSTESVTAEMVLPILKVDRQLSAHLGFVSDHFSYEEINSGLIPKTSTRDEVAGIAVSYNSAKSAPLAISANQGQRIQWVYEDSDVLDSVFSGHISSFDWRGYWGFARQHVFAARTVIGTGDDEARPFQLGGYRDGYFFVSPRAGLYFPTDAVFNRRKYALRGYDTGLSELRGSRMALIDLEWRFPISLIERGTMIMPSGVHDIKGRVFFNAGNAWFENEDRPDLLQGVGVEFSAQMIFGYMFGLEIRAGFASGLDDPGEDKAYITLGTTF